MDQISQQRFDDLRKLDTANWTEADFAFMRARRPYLSDDETKTLGLEDIAPEKPLSKMNLDELKAVAAAQNVAIEETDKKANIIAKIEAATAQ